MMMMFDGNGSLAKGKCNEIGKVKGVSLYFIKILRVVLVWFLNSLRFVLPKHIKYKISFN